jgi:acetyl-CoA carboxylase biotin carboxylase subunit
MKVLVANRGEIAVRILRACREMGIPGVAVYSDADRNALHVRMASEAIRIGAAPSRDSYLRVDRILDAARETGATAIHPGYGFLSESSQFAKRVIDAGLVWIGPNPAAIAAMGSKTESRERMWAAGVPIVPGLRRPLSGAAELEAFAAEHGFPLLLKAAAGGGGKGMRKLGPGDDLASALERASAEALAYFGAGAVYVERYVDKPRHIEIQVLGDRHGNVIHLGERECSIQRRHQKVIEECPSAVVDRELRHRMGEAAVAAARTVGYDSAGTVEFLLDEKKDFYFLEMNTRLQVEHPVTEMVTGIDLVRAMIEVAHGAELRWRQSDVSWRGHAIECRIYAEDPFRDFRPSPGRIRRLHLPEGPGIRNDSGVISGYDVPLDYDPMLAKLIAWGENREAARRRLLSALAEYRVDGLATSVPFFRAILDHPRFVAADFDTHFIEELFREGLQESHDPALEEVAFALAAIERFRATASGTGVRTEGGASAPTAGSEWKRTGRIAAATRWNR